MRETIVMVDKSSNVPKPSKSNVKEWRLFMSPRVSNTLSSVSSSETSKMHKDQHFHDQEFSKIFKEVEKLGTSQMSWKKRKEIEVQKRVALGAKPEKGHRMPISMGLSIKRKRERLEEQKLQEDFALGRITKKWKKDTEKQTASDRGLKTSEGLFRGVLYVKPLPQKREEKFQPSRGHGKSSKKHKKTKQKGKRKRR